ncbi:MAG: hypothetical protein R3B47_02965 [Bacteroidia bacterium]
MGQTGYSPPAANFPLESWRWTDLARTEGKGVRYMHEYKPNRVWFATNKGLLHFDGYEYDCQGEEEGLKGAPAHLVYTTQHGITVAATGAGLFRYSKRTIGSPSLNGPNPAR